MIFLSLIFELIFFLSSWVCSVSIHAIVYISSLYVWSFFFFNTLASSSSASPPVHGGLSQSFWLASLCATLPTRPATRPDDERHQPCPEQCSLSEQEGCPSSSSSQQTSTSRNPTADGFQSKQEVTSDVEWFNLVYAPTSVGLFGGAVTFLFCLTPDHHHHRVLGRDTRWTGISSLWITHWLQRRNTKD